MPEEGGSVIPKEKAYDPHVVGEQIKMLFQFAVRIPKQALKDTIDAIESDDAIGPLLNPSAFMGGRFERNRMSAKRAKALLKFIKCLEETNEEDPE
jgi:hypothetical protein